MDHEPIALLGGLVATGLRDVTDDPAALDSRGWWAVVATYEGAFTCARFENVRPAPTAVPTGPWRGPSPDAWRSSLDEAAYVRAVETIRAHVAAGDVYQANVCRVLTAELPDPARVDVLGLAASARRGQPVAARRRRPAPGTRGRHRVAGALPSPRRGRDRVPPDQGHRTHRGRHHRQGPRRERDDRRPDAQRPRGGRRRRGASRYPSCARWRCTPDSSTSSPP